MAHLNADSLDGFTNILGTILASAESILLLDDVLEGLDAVDDLHFDVPVLYFNLFHPTIITEYKLCIIKYQKGHSPTTMARLTLDRTQILLLFFIYHKMIDGVLNFQLMASACWQI